MDGLIIKKHWLDLILSGKKTWEIRGSNTNKRGMIALIESGSGQVVGVCELVKSIAVVPWLLGASIDNHSIQDLSSIKYENPHAWLLKNAKRIEPREYEHPHGAVIWVKDALKGLSANEVFQFLPENLSNDIILKYTPPEHDPDDRLKMSWTVFYDDASEKLLKED